MYLFATGNLSRGIYIHREGNLYDIISWNIDQDNTNNSISCYLMAFLNIITLMPKEIRVNDDIFCRENTFRNVELEMIALFEW